MVGKKTTDINHFIEALRETGRFIYENSYQLIIISLLWFILSLPIVTLGLTTLGAFVAVGQLRSEHNRLNYNQLMEIIRKQSVPATLFGIFQVILYFVVILYLSIPMNSVFQYFSFFVTLFGAIYTTIVMIPTFDALADGIVPKIALIDGLQWTTAHPTLSLLLVLILFFLLVTSLVLTIAFPLLFAGFAVSFNIHIVSTNDRVNCGDNNI